ncbi:hypothetical protein HY418_00170 [Candidatus Kaiserbacteria bacterium]|nr:hypothetical protein [Candidatus Kaiserbacteria bacterium]
MCGILGITEKNEGLVRDAARTFAYRGPDASAVLSGDEVTLGHNRLSIIDLDPRANQPMKDAGDTHRIIFNGEIYNYKELKRELASDYPFTTESDTEVLLAAYRTWGSDMTRHLRGMYAFAIHDRRAGKLVLATDYSGMKPIFYTCINKTFAFASELKGILAMIREKGIMPEVDRDSLDLYWALGYVPAPRTIYKGLYRMPRRTLLTIDVSSGE